MTSAPILRDIEPELRTPRLVLRCPREGSYAFDALGARRVAAMTDAANVASRRLCESVGMQLEGVLRNERVTPAGVLCDTSVYAALADRSVA